MSDIVESEVLEIPNAWKAGVITNKGLGLLSKLITGNTLNITRAETGTGWVAPELLPKQTAVSEPKQALTFQAVSYPEEGRCSIPCKLTNAEVTESYIARQIGLYAEDPDEGEILFYITQVEDEDGGTGIPAANIIPSYSSTWNLVIYYGMADGVHVTVDPAGAVTQEQMENFVVEYLDLNLRPATIEEIEEALQLYGGGGSGESGGSGGTSGVGTYDHSMLYNRNIEDQHTISAITGLEEALEELEQATEDAAEESISSTNIDDIWNDVMSDESES